MNYEELCQKIVDKDNFSFSRWGDGEWEALLGYKGKNCDGHTYFPEMGMKLLQIVSNPARYYFGLQNFAKKTLGNELVPYLSKQSWVNSDMLHHASIKGQLHQFFDALNTRRVVIVGPDRLQGLKAFDWERLIHIPTKDCWMGYPGVKERLADIEEDTVVLYCASMMSNVLIDDTWDFHEDTITQIDCGSLFEPYIGVANRTYHKRLTDGSGNTLVK